MYKFLENAIGEFTIIFADPPYAFIDEQFASIVDLVFGNKLLENDGLLVIEHSKQTNLSHISGYSYSKHYGGSVFSFFEHTQSE